jgi:hypothetical protein
VHDQVQVAGYRRGRLARLAAGDQVEELAVALRPGDSASRERGQGRVIGLQDRYLGGVRSFDQPADGALAQVRDKSLHLGKFWHSFDCA